MIEDDMTKKEVLIFLLCYEFRGKGLRSVMWVEKPVCCCNACTAIYGEKK